MNILEWSEWPNWHVTRKICGLDTLGRRRRPKHLRTLLFFAADLVFAGFATIKSRRNFRKFRFGPNFVVVESTLLYLCGIKPPSCLRLGALGNMSESRNWARGSRFSGPGDIRFGFEPAQGTWTLAAKAWSRKVFCGITTPDIFVVVDSITYKNHSSAQTLERSCASEEKTNERWSLSHRSILRFNSGCEPVYGHSFWFDSYFFKGLIPYIRHGLVKSFVESRPQ